MVNRALSDAGHLGGMDVVELARMIAALVFVLGLIGLAYVAARRWSPLAVLKVRPQARRRLQVVDSLVLDTHRRLVLVRYDDTEQLILLGEGRVLASSARRAESGDTGGDA
jgi:flagellar protein FliO/FliZ